LRFSVFVPASLLYIPRILIALHSYMYQSGVKCDFRCLRDFVVVVVKVGLSSFLSFSLGSLLEIPASIHLFFAFPTLSVSALSSLLLLHLRLYRAPPLWSNKERGTISVSWHQRILRSSFHLSRRLRMEGG